MVRKIDDHFYKTFLITKPLVEILNMVSSVKKNLLLIKRIHFAFNTPLASKRRSTSKNINSPQSRKKRFFHDIFILLALIFNVSIDSAAYIINLFLLYFFPSNQIVYRSRRNKNRTWTVKNEFYEFSWHSAMSHFLSLPFPTPSPHFTSSLNLLFSFFFNVNTTLSTLRKQVNTFHSLWPGFNGTFRKNEFYGRTFFRTTVETLWIEHQWNPPRELLNNVNQLNVCSAINQQRADEGTI